MLTDNLPLLAAAMPSLPTSVMLLAAGLLIGLALGFLVKASPKAALPSLDAEEKLRLQQELAAAKCSIEQAKTAENDFLLSLAHQIRTPLNGILGNAELLKDYNLSQGQKILLNDLIISGEILSSTICSALDLSKICSDRLSLAPLPFSLNRLVEELSAAIKRQAESKGLHFSCAQTVRHPIWLCGDAPRLRQALLHLLDNSVRYTNRGHVTLHVSCQESPPPLGPPATDAGSAQLSFRIEDSGPGLPKELLDFLTTEDGKVISAADDNKIF